MLITQQLVNDMKTKVLARLEFSFSYLVDYFIILSNLYKRLMHLHSDRYRGPLPIHHLNTCQWNFRSPGIQHCLAIFFLFFLFHYQTKLFFWQLMLKNIPVGDKQQLRPSDPRKGHKQFPRHHCKIFPLFLLTFDFHLLTLRRNLQPNQDLKKKVLIFLKNR